MSDLLKHAQEIAKAIVEETDDIDLILVYGSLARGTANPFSDIDLLIISDKVSVSCSFVFIERPVSIHTMSWEEIVGVAKGSHGTWSTGASIFENHLVLWSRSKNTEQQFRDISRYISDGSQEVLRRTITNFTSLYGQLWRLQDAVNHIDVLTPPFLVWNIATAIAHILSALNKKPMKHNWGRQLSEMADFETAPPNFTTRYTQLVTSSPEEALPIATNLVLDLDILVRQWFNDQKLSKADSISMIEDEWSGIVDCLNKVHSAAQTQELVAVRYAAVEFAEFAIWFLRSIQGDQSDPKHFKKTLDELDKLSPESQKPLEVLLVSMEIDDIVEASEQLADLLKSRIEGEGVKPPIAKSATEAKAHLRISSM
ncbi:MAG: nucleotidyltransferase domain-containing protein [Candidatus Thorarchaeota archaeon]